MPRVNLNYCTEAELVEKIASGDERAFEQLYRIYNPKVYYYLRKLTNDNDLAEELLQQVFMKVWEKRSMLNAQKLFMCYLYRMSENLVTDFYRKARRDKKAMEALLLVASELIAGPIETIISKEDDGLLQQAINKLPPQRMKIFVLCKFEGKSYEEVGALLGISTSTISDHIVKATKSIKTSLLASMNVAG